MDFPCIFWHGEVLFLLFHIWLAIALYTVDLYLSYVMSSSC